MRGLKRVLVADDDQATRHLCSDVLSAAGYEVKTAPDGMEALKAVTAPGAGFDLILTDAQMPELDGISFYRLAVGNCPALKGRFIFMTGNPGKFMRDSAGLKLKCIAKPFRVTELMSHIDLIALGPMERRGPRRSKSSRTESRFEISLECEVFEKEKAGHRATQAMAENLSKTGLRVRYGRAALKAGAGISVFMNINSMHLLRSAKVAWTKEAAPGREWVSGLKLERPMPVSSILDTAESVFSKAAV